MVLFQYWRLLLVSAYFEPRWRTYTVTGLIWHTVKVEAALIASHMSIDYLESLDQSASGWRKSEFTIDSEFWVGLQQVWCMDWWMDAWMDGQLGERTDGQMREWMEQNLHLFQVSMGLEPSRVSRSLWIYPNTPPFFFFYLCQVWWGSRVNFSSRSRCRLSAELRSGFRLCGSPRRGFPLLITCKHLKIH